MSASLLQVSPVEQLGVASMRRIAAISGIDQLRLIVTAVLAFLLVDFVRLALAAPAVVPMYTVMDALAYVALICLLWWPRVGLVLAAVPLGSALFWPSTSLEAPLVCGTAAFTIPQFRRVAAMAVSGGLAAYVTLRIVQADPDNRVPMGTVFGLSLALGVLIGWAGYAEHQRRKRSAAAASAAAAEESRIREDERLAITRDLHDVVVHQLSNVSLQIMGSQGSPDVQHLHRVIERIDAATAEALNDLRLLIRVLRAESPSATTHTEIGELSERLPPTLAAAAAELELVAAGFEPDVEVPAAADRLPLTVQRTLSRGIQVASEITLEAAQPGCRHSVRLRLSDSAATLDVRATVDAHTDIPWSWSLKALRERTRLTGGELSFTVAGDECVLSLKLPLD